MSDPAAPPRLELQGRHELGRAPEVLAVGPEGVGSTGTLANALYLAEQTLRDRWPRLLSALRHVQRGPERALVFALHPAGGPVELRLDEQGHLRLSGSTALAGPGYQHFLHHEVARALGQALSVQWAPARPPPVEAHYLDWLRAQARQALATWLSAPAAGELHWLQPLDPAVGHWQGRGAVATMVGPRTEAWLQAVVADPAAGLDVFPWWPTGTGVPYMVGRARCVLWRDVRWRQPTTPEEFAALSEVSNLLTQAWELDPDLADAPWSGWLDVLCLLGEAESRRERVRARCSPGPLPGYRRHRVREALPGGWTITLPGSMGVSWTEDEGWCAWDQGRTAWFSALEGQGEPELGAPGAVIVRELSLADGRALVCRGADEDGDPLHLLSGVRRQGDQLGLVTLAWQEDPGGRSWAEAAWRSLKR